MPRRAARIADGFIGGAAETDVHREECRRLGKTPGEASHLAAYPPKVAMITHDPEAGWAAFGKYAFHVTGGGGQWKGKPPDPAPRGLQQTWTRSVRAANISS